jgi:hypothetical protein
LSNGIKITRKKISNEPEKDILTGVIVSLDYTREVSILLAENLKYFKAPHIKIVIRWCLDYFNTYDKVPYGSIMDIFTVNAEELPRDEDIDFIDDILSNVSTKYLDSGEEYDAQFNIKKTVDYCKKISLENLASEIKGLVDTGRSVEAENRVADYSRIDLDSTTGINADRAANRRKALYSPDNSKIVAKFPGAFGQLIGPLERGGLYLIAAISKMGKSWVSLYIGILCRMYGLNVHYYTLEMSEDKLQERYDMARFHCWKYELPDNYDEEEVYVPSDRTKRLTTPHFNDCGGVDFITDTYHMLSAERCNRKERYFNGQYRKGSFHIYDITKTGNTLRGIIANEDNEEKYTGRKSDILIIDSIYLCSDGRGEKEYQRYDDLHRRAKQELGEKRGKVVITPFQFNRDAVKGDGDESNLAGSYSVFSHASAALYLRATDAEKEKGLFRIGANGRDNNYGGEIVCTRNLDLGLGVIDSRWRKEIPDYDSILGCEVPTEDDMSELMEMSGTERLEDV